ncbi:hypothetical protein [Myroides odoratimimus]|uniref:hypothetical protein n=1 Tax=Myroides odoratimimus TaxID=76832 RepID=UPI002575040F|nr:hypothetical protein [Myroides odoratimimus]MDM1521516.1 hypothetical protein [Myroides odoratimimus]
MKNKIPYMHCIQVDSFEEQIRIVQKMSMMQRTHNKLAEDFEFLKIITKKAIDENEISQPLIRACIKEFFSLVEGDLFLINQYLPYKEYSDKDNLINKFKKTFRHHSESFEKVKIKDSYQSKSYEKFYRLKLKRDQIVHPKSLQSIDVSIQDFNDTSDVYSEYRNYILQLMTNIGFSSQIKL